jgi:phosphatidylserine decarboxylase
MAANEFIQKLSNQEALNFLLTNRIPRRLLTRWMGRFSKIERPWVTRLSLAIWRLFADDLNLAEAKKTSFNSLHDCFTRELKPGARPFSDNADVIISPCDAVVGAFGDIAGNQLFQVKGFPYTLEDLLGNVVPTQKYRNGRFVTLRLKSSMYHRFHAPCDASLAAVHYIAGDTWNVNPIALKRVERLFCKNERAVLELQLNEKAVQTTAETSNAFITLVPVAAILVASMKFHCLDDTLDMDYSGPARLPCHGVFRKGDEIGYFQHGSTIVLLASRHFAFRRDLQEGSVIRMGEPLLTKTNDTLEED